MSDRQLTPWAEAVTVHSLAWLTFGNLIGLLMATLLSAPRLGRLLGPLTYGRWAPLHLDSQLYGWLGLPLVGLLLRAYLGDHRFDRLGEIAVGIWSGTLLFGCLSWLLGSTSGKPFLEWSGSAAAVLAAGTGFLALLLTAAFGRQAKHWKRLDRRGRLAIAAKGALLLLLLPIPMVLYRVAQPDVYPSFNPDSGGATGGSLLGSNLVVVALFLAAPSLLGLERPAMRSRTPALVVLLVAHAIWFALLDHGNHSHHELFQIVSLFSLAIWPPLLWRFVRAYRWPAAARRWLLALAAWGGALVLSGLLTFLPGILEAEKFTNALVAHAHLAMAGMATSFCMLVLLGLDPGGRLTDGLGAPGPFARWQIGCAVQVGVLLALGFWEASDPGLVYRGAALSRIAYLLRWTGGLLMLVASLEWLLGVARLRRPATVPSGWEDWVPE